MAVDHMSGNGWFVPASAVVQAPVYARAENSRQARKL